MSFFRLLLRNLVYHWRGNGAVLLGVAVGTAVLTGALLVGDSLRGSLRELTEKQLGWVDAAMVTGRFVRGDLAKEFPGARVAPALILHGAASTVPPEGSRDLPKRVGHITVIGYDDNFGFFWDKSPAPDSVVLNSALARDLGVTTGDKITLHVQKASGIPREVLLGRRDEQSVLGRIQVPVGAVIEDEAPQASFSLTPSPAAPRNAFVPLALLQKQLDVKGRVNALLASGARAAALQADLKRALTLDDWGLVLKTPKNRDYMSLESRQLLLEPAVADAALAAAKDSGLRAAPTLVYLANTIAADGGEIPYSVVAALDPTEKSPLGPFLPPGVESLKDDEIILADWKDSPLKVKPGDEVTLKYFEPVEGGQLREAEAKIRLAGLVPMNGPAADQDLTPTFPGITDKLNIAEWDPPFPYDNKRIKGRDDRYWRQYRTTPKAYVTLKRGQELWGSRFGKLTSVRLAPADEGRAADFRKRLLAHLNPEDGGFVFDPVRERALKASAGGNDFGGLFLGFSCFLIVAALLLVGLLFRLNLDRRAPEIGLLMATGFRRRTVFLLLLAEGAVLAAVGAVLGSLLALLYLQLMLYLLRRLWPGGLEQSFLQSHPTGTSLGLGLAAAFLVSLGTIAWAMLALRKVPPRALLAGETAAPGAAAAGRPRWSIWIAIGCAVLGLALLPLGRFIHDSEARASVFFGSGFLLLIAALAAAWAWMRSTRHVQVGGHGGTALARLGVRNAARHPVRSLLTAGLLASAAFLLVAVESFRRQAGDDFLAKDAGSGGFDLVAESEVPIYQDLNGPEGWQELSDALELRLRDKAALKEATEMLGKATFEQFRVRAGDDTSCLNLYQPRKPRLLGVPPSLVGRGGFRFADSLAKTDDEKRDPWLLLNRTFDGGAIPVIGEANTVKWMLKSDLGNDIAVADDRGNPVRLRVVALLSDSVFQSGLLMSEANFLKLYPSVEGYNFFLVASPPGQTQRVKQQLETALGDRGFDVTPSARRLEAYLAVENMYLSTFQVLGGFGLLLGTLGLAVVLLRSVWERRGELALLLALGYRHRALGWLLLSENGFLLLLGLGVGAATALLAVAPHLVGGGGAIPWPELVGMLAAVLLVGLAVATAALAATLRAPLVPALRRE
jgi:ABC-type antimicrobial peptide transport system permease subunit